MKEWHCHRCISVSLHFRNSYMYTCRREDEITFTLNKKVRTETVDLPCKYQVINYVPVTTCAPFYWLIYTSS